MFGRAYLAAAVQVGPYEWLHAGLQDSVCLDVLASECGVAAPTMDYFIEEVLVMLAAEVAAERGGGSADAASTPLK